MTRKKTLKTQPSSEQVPETPADLTTQKAKTSRRFGKGVLWLLNAGLALTTVAILSVGALVFYLRSAPLEAPDWARAKVEARLAEVLPQARVSFGEMVFVMGDDWQPRVRLRHVIVRSPAGQDIVRLNEFSAAFAGAPLLNGDVQPKAIALTGIVAQLDRDAQGRVRLRAIDGVAAADSPAKSVPEVIAQLDEVLASPTLNVLRSIELRALTLRYEDARAARAWTVDGGRVVVSRDGDALDLNADLAVLSGGAGVATVSANFTSQIGERAAEFGASFSGVAAADIAAQGPAFAWLGALRAPISGSVRTGLLEDGRFAPLAATLQIGAGVVQPNTATDPIPFESARAYFNYDPAARLLSFDELSVQSKWISGEASGTAQLGLDENTGKLDDLIGQITLGDLSANPAGLYEAPMQMAGGDADFRLQVDPFRITLGRAQLKDQDKTLRLNGELTADPKGWRVAVDGQMDGIDPRRLLALWPERAARGTRNWLDANLIAGDVTNIDLALRVAPGTKRQTYVAFDYDKAKVRFAKIFPPVTGARGHFTLNENRLVIAVDDGIVSSPKGGEIAVTGSSFIIPDVTVKDGAPAVVRLETKSSITSVLSLLNMAPLSVMDKANLPVGLAEGRAELTGTLALPLKPKAKVTYYVEGDLLDVRSETLVKNRNLQGDRLRVRAENTEVSVSGSATLDGVPFEGGWTQPIGKPAAPAIVAGDIALTPQSLATFGVKLPPGVVGGAGTAQLRVDLPRGAPPAFTIRSDLRGVRMTLPEVSWRKGANTPGLLEVSGRFGTPARVDSLIIDAPGLDARGSVTLNADATLERVRFDALNVGNWLRVPLDLVGRGAGRPVQVVLRGGSLDLRRAEFGASQSGAAGGPPMQVVLDRLQISDTIALTNMRGQFKTGGGLDGAFQAQINGQAAVQGRLVPQNGRSAVRLVSQNAGSVLRAAGVLKQVVGGNLSLLLLPVGSGGAFDGRLTVGDVRIKDAPGIAALINAVSVVGLVNELNGDGIYFDNVEAAFRLTPNLLTLTEASAVGTSLGLSMDGRYALDSGALDLQGVISPIYLLNGIGSLLTRKGEGLIGFNYTLTGTAKAPSVGVNPLSVLTPGMFRDIFRAPPPELPAVDGVTESTLPKVPPTKPIADVSDNR